MNSKTNLDERRYSERVSWECQARLLPLSLQTRVPILGMHNVTGRDISEGGLQVWSDQLFEIKSRLLVEMESAEFPEGIQAVGSVAWISPTTSERQWLVGIEFSDIGDCALSSIRTLLNMEPIAECA